MNASGVIYPQFWVQHEAKHKFMAQLSILKIHYCFGKQIGPKQLFILSYLCLMNIVGATNIFFQAHYAYQLPCCHESSFGL